MTRGFASRLTTMKPINIKLVMSKFLLSVHPDVMQVEKGSPNDIHQSIKDQNEDALKTLNAFLDIAAAGCNGELKNDDLNTREFPLTFHIPTPRKLHKKAKATDKQFVRVDGEMYTRIAHVAKLSDQLVEASEKALLHSRHVDLAAVYWRKYTNSVLKSLYVQAGIPVISGYPNGELLPWDEETERQADEASIFESTISFEKKFKAMLTRERDIVFPLTTGYEEDVSKHHVLLSLLRRTHADSLPPDQRTAAFNWIGAVLLRNFMELRMANPVWNRVVIILSDVHGTRDVIQDDRSIALVVGFTTDVDPLVDFMHDAVATLEATLDAAAPRPTTTKKKRRLAAKPKRLY
ncbi:Aste57867_13729 [Aphanomyces stellatus]|uniref:Aste57867_13729 protein n=1 Tax=Aphanomyces stellatus TaxID=120398 RepID=A0A485KZL1_9STRA|nr:hypothetical protein As57867_013679 [Aphanomyces stellatus]VFT90562.1 Aste57867_13729 [Aphanomyces stellatus]